MRIALLSTCALSVPPKAYGGTELVIAELAKSLTRRGHDVTVFATGDSHPEAHLRWHFAEPVWPPNELAEVRHCAFSWRDIAREELSFDVVHAHQAPAIAFSAVVPVATVLTLHNDRAEKLLEFYKDFPDVTYVAISHRQCQLVPELPIADVVHHGLDIDAYEAGPGPGEWVAFVGRFAPEKGPHLAIDAATAAGVRLRMGGQAHWVNEGFFEREVRPRIARAAGRVIWEGEVAFEPKLDLLRGARATLFPIDWEEPFGLVMIESMLLGTPVIAYARGSAPEVVDEGVTGFVVHDLREMVERIRDVGAIDRRRCRERARERWSADRMAGDYERLYERAIARTARPGRGAARSHPVPRTGPTALGGDRHARGVSSSGERTGRRGVRGRGG